MSLRVERGWGLLVQWLAPDFALLVRALIDDYRAQAGAGLATFHIEHRVVFIQAEAVGVDFVLFPFDDENLVVAGGLTCVRVRVQNRLCRLRGR